MKLTLLFLLPLFLAACADRLTVADPLTPLPAATAVPVQTSTPTPTPLPTPMPTATPEPLLPISVMYYVHPTTGIEWGDRIRVKHEGEHVRTYGEHPGCAWVLNRVEYYASQPDKWFLLANDLRLTWRNAPLQPTRRIGILTAEYCEHGGPILPERSVPALHRAMRQLHHDIGPAPTPGTVPYYKP